jgi:ABC-type Na+ transport system ATPase subunit NatA
VSPASATLPSEVSFSPAPFNYNIFALQRSQGLTGQTHDATCIQSFTTFTDNDALDALVGSCNSSSFEGSGFMGFLGPRAPCRLSKGADTLISVPFTQPQPTHDWRTVWSEMYSHLLALNDIPFNTLENSPDTLNVSDAIIHFHELSPRPMKAASAASLPPRINITMSVNDVEMAVYHRPNNFTRLYGAKAPRFFGQSQVLLVPFAQLNMLEFLTSSMQSWALLPPENSHVPSKLSNLLTSSSTLQGMPYTDFSSILVAVEAFGLVLYPICVSLQLPVYLYLFVNEKETKLRAFASAMGLTKFVFWSSNYLFCLLMYATVVLSFVIGANVISLRLWSHTPVSVLIIMLGGWGLSLVAVAAFLQSFISNTRSASIVGYSVSLLGAAVGIVVAVGIYFEDGKIMPAYWLLWPQFALTRALFLMDTACIKRLVCFGSKDLLSGEFAGCVWSMYAAALFYSAAAWFFDSTNSSNYPKASAFIQRLLKFFANVFKSPVQNLEGSMTECLIDHDRVGSSSVASALVTYGTDPDVLEERDRVKMMISTSNVPANTPLIVDDLRKVYHNRQLVAVDRLSLAVGAGECFGLLGPNGAGKSTSVGVLMGLTKATSGDALIAGYSVCNQLSDAQQNIGICPQHSVFWETLSALENLLFFIRLKGSTHTRTEDMSLACDCLHEVFIHVLFFISGSYCVQVGLLAFKDRAASELSGGMRRRLSIAIALGSSRCVYLDEPTTGLDVISRRQVNALHFALDLSFLVPLIFGTLNYKLDRWRRFGKSFYARVGVVIVH